MPKFTVRIRETIIDAEDPVRAAMEQAASIALMKTINIFDVVDESGRVHEVILTNDQTDRAIAQGVTMRDAIK